MKVDIASAGKTAVNTALGQFKTYILPMAVGLFVIAIVVGFVPQTKKFLQ